MDLADVTELRRYTTEDLPSIRQMLIDVHADAFAYESWGYRKVGESRPFADSPLYALMVADLPLTADSSAKPDPSERGL